MEWYLTRLNFCDLERIIFRNFMKVIQKRSRKPNSAEDTFVCDGLSGVILDITNKPILTDSE